MSREEQREEFDELAGFGGQGASFSNPLWDSDKNMYYCGAGLWRAEWHPVIKRRIKAGTLAPPPKRRGK